MNIKKYTIFKIFLFYFFFRIKFFIFFIQNLKFSKSQIFQDIFVLYYLNNKNKGVFIEIGGGDGVALSNTYILEKNKTWYGIICEPDIRLINNIKKKRNCILETKPVSHKCNDLVYFDTDADTYSASIKKKKSNKFLKKTICLNHLIKKYNLKKDIDYISIDTEGNEYNIIKNFDFKKYKVKVFTIEHNFNKNFREKIYNKMKKNGYERVFKSISYMDDWYVLL